MKKRYFIPLLVLIFLAVVVLFILPPAEDPPSSGDSQGFNPPDRSVEEATESLTVFPLLTEPSILEPAITTPSPSASQATTSMVISGQLLVNNRCTVCHSISTIMNAEKSPEEWAATVEEMVFKGAVLDQIEKESVITYLSQAFPAQELDIP